MIWYVKKLGKEGLRNSTMGRELALQTSNLSLNTNHGSLNICSIEFCPKTKQNKPRKEKMKKSTKYFHHRK